MRSSEIPNFPHASPTYDEQHTELTIRSIEQYLQELRGDVISNRDATDSTASLALRRHQFLLMGA